MCPCRHCAIARSHDLQRPGRQSEPNKHKKHNKRQQHERTNAQEKLTEVSHSYIWKRSASTQGRVAKQKGTNYSLPFRLYASLLFFLLSIMLQAGQRALPSSEALSSPVRLEPVQKLPYPFTN